MKLLRTCLKLWRNLRKMNGNVLDDGTIIVGNMRCYRTGFGNLKCKECGEIVDPEGEYWMSEHTTLWSGDLDEPVTQGYCRGCAAEKADILVRKPLMLHLHDSTEERHTI